jgi:hypothetical protein
LVFSAARRPVASGKAQSSLRFCAFSDFSERRQIETAGRSFSGAVSTPYRNEIDALRERKTALEAELLRLREQTTQLDELKAREAALAAELAGVDGRLSAGIPKRALPLLDQVRVASPCNADWNEMLGDGRVRFCLSCEKNVYNLSAMTRDAAEELLRERLGNDLCVRFYQRADGTILTEDCPTGVKKKRRKKLALAVAGAGAMAAAAATAFMSQKGDRGGPVSGAVMYVDDPQARGEMIETKGEAAPIPTVMGSAVPTPIMGAPPPLPTAPTRVHPEPKNDPAPRMGKPTMMGRR